jgi:hypothetical protein
MPCLREQELGNYHPARKPHPYAATEVGELRQKYPIGQTKHLNSVFLQSTSKIQVFSTMNGPLFGKTLGGDPGLGQNVDAQAVAAAKNVSFAILHQKKKIPKKSPWRWSREQNDLEMQLTIE